jgi:hypothetical protein
MIVNNLNFERIAISPDETNTILIVDTNTVLALPITLQSFEMITWKYRQISQLMSRVYLH